MLILLGPTHQFYMNWFLHHEPVLFSSGQSLLFSYPSIHPCTHPSISSLSISAGFPVCCPHAYDSSISMLCSIFYQAWSCPQYGSVWLCIFLKRKCSCSGFPNWGRNSEGLSKFGQGMTEDCTSYGPCKRFRKPIQCWNIGDVKRPEISSVCMLYSNTITNHLEYFGRLMQILAVSKIQIKKLLLIIIVVSLNLSYHSKSRLQAPERPSITSSVLKRRTKGHICCHVECQSISWQCHCSNFNVGVWHDDVKICVIFAHGLGLKQRRELYTWMGGTACHGDWN